MKKVMFALLSGALMLTSCDKEDDKKEKQPSELIIGNWDLDRVDYVNYENDVEVGTETEYMDLQLMFTANNFIVVSELDTFDMGTYKVSAANLDLYGGDTANFTLKSLTETELKLFMVEEYHFDTIHFRDEGTWYFTK